MSTPRRLGLASLALLAASSLGCGGAETPRPAAPPVCPTASAAAPTASAPVAAPAAPAPRPVELAPDEGMWTFDAFPSERVQKLHGFAPDKAWLDHVRLSSLRLGRGCSASIVSKNGLVMTNHHCAEQCLSELSTKAKDLMETGFSARTEEDEPRCPGLEVNQLVAIEDVTARVNAATKDVPEAEFAQKQKAAMSSIEKECGTADDVRCEVVSLYHGGFYHLYRYRRFDDVRLVFAPEFRIAFFGGDPDNFMFPRYDLDVTFVRLYRGGKPVETPDHFAWSAAGPKEGELTFVSGNPYQTQRLLTVAELEYIRDVSMPEGIARLSELRGMLAEFRSLGAEQKRIAHALFFGVENGLKARKGREGALVDKAFFAKKVAEEQALRAFVAADPALAAKAGGAWDAIARAQHDLRDIHEPLDMLEGGQAFESRLFEIARLLVRAADELPKPNAERLREFADSRLPTLKQRLLSTAPIHAELEALTLGWSLGRMREVLGADSAAVRDVLGKDAPRELAAALVKGTKLFDPKVRKALLDGGKAAIDASKDPMIALAKRVDPAARRLRKQNEDTIEAVVKKSSEAIAKAYFAMHGTSTYPDATGTLRLSFGVVKGWVEAGVPVPPFTYIGGAFERDTGKDPFALPKSWLAARAKLRMDTPLDLVTDNDIIGGNSGSPLVDAAGKIVGLVFDGNIHSLGGAYGYDPTDNRTVAVDSAALLAALDRVYGAGRLLGELER
jgi:hypothetical protein